MTEKDRINGELEGEIAAPHRNSSELEAVKARLRHAEKLLRQRDRVEELLRIERNLGVALSSKIDLQEALEHVMDAALEIEGIECGGIYLVDSKTGIVDLACHRGLSKGFVDYALSYERGSPKALIVMKGDPVYIRYSEFPHHIDDIIRGEGIRALAIAPIKYEGSVVACLNLATRTADEMPPFTRNAIETISFITGVVIMRIKAERALEEQYNLLQIFIDALPNPIYFKDANRLYLGYNKAFQEYHNVTAEELLGKSVHDLRPEEEADIHKEADIELLHNPGRKIYEFTLDHPDGTVRNLCNYKSTFMRPDGAVGGIVGILLDETEKKKAEAALRESEEKYRSIVENAIVGIFQSTPDGRFLSVNQALADMSGFDSPEEMIQSIHDIATQHYVVPEEREEFKRMLRQYENVKNFEHQVYRKDGNVFWVSVSARDVRDEKGDTLYFEGGYEDITRRKEVEEEREKLRAQLLQSRKMEAIGTLAGGIAHDFNNLLMSIQGYTSLMLYNMEPDRDHYNKLKSIESIVRSGADLTKQLLGFARGGKYETKTVNVNDIIEKSSTMFGRTKKELSIFKKLRQDIHATEADQGQIEQALINLYVNAWQAMPAGGDLYIETDNVVLDEEHGKIHSVKPGMYVRISITDTGVGMDRRTKERVFEPFFTTKEMGRGTGLGLASVYGIIRNHHGIINVYSEKGRGTTFNIYLPVSEKAVAREEDQPERFFKGAETVLLVDDEELVINVNKEILEALGYKVYTAMCGRDAVEIYNEKHRDIAVIILDMVMPDLGGGETFEFLKMINPDVKVILSSGYSLNGQAAMIIRKGCRAFIQKPFTMNELSRKLRDVLDLEPGEST